MGSVDPTTQYLFLEIHAMLTVPGDRTSIRGLHTVLKVEEIAQRPRNHVEETYSISWDSRFRIERNAGRTRPPDEQLVQVLVHVRMMERIPNPDMLMTRQFVHAVAHSQVTDPYAEPTRALLARLGEERFRKKFWAVACVIINKEVTSAHLEDSM